MDMVFNAIALCSSISAFTLFAFLLRDGLLGKLSDFSKVLQSFKPIHGIGAIAGLSTIVYVTVTMETLLSKLLIVDLKRLRQIFTRI